MQTVDALRRAVPVAAVAAVGRHLLRDPEPAGRGEDRSRRRSSCSSSSGRRTRRTRCGWSRSRSRPVPMPRIWSRTPTAIDESWLDGVSSVGLSVRRVGARDPRARGQRWLAERGYGDLDEVTHTEERLTFALPQELRRDLRAERYFADDQPDAGDDQHGRGGRGDCREAVDQLVGRGVEQRPSGRAVRSSGRRAAPAAAEYTIGGAITTGNICRSLDREDRDDRRDDDPDVEAALEPGAADACRSGRRGRRSRAARAVRPTTAARVRAHGSLVVRDQSGEPRPPRPTALLGGSLADRVRTPGLRGPTPEPIVLPRPRRSAPPGAARCGWPWPDAVRCARSSPDPSRRRHGCPAAPRAQWCSRRRCVDARWSWASTSRRQTCRPQRSLDPGPHAVCRGPFAGTVPATR